VPELKPKDVAYNFEPPDAIDMEIDGEHNNHLV
jgi:hypothetical protein